MVIDDSIYDMYAGYARWGWDVYGRIDKDKIQFCSQYVDRAELHLHERTRLPDMEQLPDDVLEIMNGPKWFRQDDCMDFEKFALKPRNVRQP